MKEELKETKFERSTVKNGKKVQLRVLPPSEQAVNALGMRTRREFVSPIAINRPSIEKSEIGMERVSLMRKLAEMPGPLRQLYLRENEPIDFIKDKSGYQQYRVTCTRCGDPVATVWAKDATLKDWVDLHYITEMDKDTWYGCRVVNVSQVDEQLGFECCCGEDTRDFRGKNHLPPVLRDLAIDYSMKHRGFNHGNAAFIAIKI